MLNTLAILAAEAENTIELPMSKWGFGGIALALFLVLFLLLWSFRGTAQKIAESGSTHHDHAEGGHGGTHH